MNKTVLLVQEWVNFQEKHPEASVEEFCRDFLYRKNKMESIRDPHCAHDYLLTYSLSKSINRLSKLWMYFTLQAIKPLGLSSFDEFTFLFTANQYASIRKKDLIYLHFIEMSSGLLVIDRLLNKGFLKEKTDEQDKRSKQVSLTQKGKVALKSCHVELSKVAESLYRDMPKEDMERCIEYLSPLEHRIAQQWHQIKRFEPAIEGSM